MHGHACMYLLNFFFSKVLCRTGPACGFGRIPKSRDILFLKRYPFEHEREFRVIFESATKKRTKLDISIPLSCIERITLSPWLHSALSSHMKSMLKSIRGCKSLTITRSTLISNEQWKKLGDSTSNRRSHRRLPLDDCVAARPPGLRSGGPRASSALSAIS